MSSANVEATRRIYDAMARGNFWVVRDYLDPEVVWQWSTNLAGLTGVSEYHGPEGVETATRDFFKCFELFRQEALELVESGDRVLVKVRTHSRPKGSDREFDGTVANLWTFRDGKVVRFRLFESWEDALAALESPPGGETSGHPGTTEPKTPL